MKKNVRLADIYVRIYNKRPLTLDDLIFLSKYDRECFEKTYQNVMYHIPEAKEQMHSEEKEEASPKEPPKEEVKEPLPREKPDIHAMLNHIKEMKLEDFPMTEIKEDSVKDLLGNLYMEMLFPHNDKYRYFQLEDGMETSTFNKKA